MKILVATLLVAPLALLCSCDSALTGDGTSSDTFDGMFTATTAGGDPTKALGTWGLTKTESEITVDVRVTLTATEIRLASRCTKGAQSVIAGIDIAATVTDTHMSVTESKTASQPIAQTKCQTQLTAGEADLAITGGKLNFGGVFLFDTKFSD